MDALKGHLEDIELHNNYTLLHLVKMASFTARNVLAMGRRQAKVGS